MLLSLLEQNPYLLEVINNTEDLGLPNCFVAGACFAQTYWNIQHGFNPSVNIKDIDLIYFDPSDLSQEAEQKHAQRIQERFAHIAVPVDVKNQARVHLWYQQKFGYAIEAYGSSTEAIDTFPITAGCIGICKEKGECKIYSTFGFDDLFGGIVQPNKKQITKDIYEAKLLRWKPLWPNLTYVEW